MEFGLGSDYKAIVKFTSGGSEVSVTSVSVPSDFTLEYYTTNDSLKKTASRASGVYTNCLAELNEGVVRLTVAIDDVEWGEGDVVCKATFYYPDTDFVDEIRKHVEYIETGDSYVRI